MPAKGGSAWRVPLDGDPDVQRWLRNLARGSRETSKVYERSVGAFLFWAKLTPKQLVRKDPKKAADLLEDYIAAQEKNGLARGTIAMRKAAVVSWLEWNGVGLGHPVTIRNLRERPTLKDKAIPEPAQVRRALNAANPRTKAMIALLAFSGMKPQVLGNYEGNDGLRLGDLPDLRMKDGDVSFERIPTLIRVRAGLAINRQDYFTFLGPEGCEYVAAYLRGRLHEGERLTADSPVIGPERGPGAGTTPFLRRNNIGIRVQGALRMAGLKEMPYILRSYFSSRSMLAESRGWLRNWREFCMGHQNDTGRTHAMGKGLPTETVEAMRAAYEAALPYLETMPQASKAFPIAQLAETFLLGAGVPEAEAQARVKGKSRDELTRMILELKVMPHSRPGSKPADGNKGDRWREG